MCVETGGELQPPLTTRIYEGLVVYGRDEDVGAFTIEAPDGAEIGFTFGPHLLVGITPPHWDDLTDEQRYFFKQGWSAGRESTEPEPQFAYESINDLPTDGAAA